VSDDGGTQPRACRVAHRVLLRVAQDDAYADRALNVALERTGLSSRERGLATELVYGTLRHALHLDFLIGALSDRPMKRLAPAVLAALRLGAYQVLHTRVPPPIAVNDSVNLIREEFRHAAPYVNAVLRKLVTLNEAGELPDPSASLGDTVAAFALKMSHPAWVLDEVCAERGDAGMRAWVAANNERPPLALRVNRRRANRADLAAALVQGGARVELPPLFADALRVEGAGYVGDLPGFVDGHFTVQDPAAQLVSTLVDPRPGELVLDACAAPGGKSTHLAELADDAATILAADVHPAKTRLVQATAERLQLASIRINALDATEPLTLGAWVREHGRAQVDRALIDAPCTGFGTLRRNPELRMRGPAIMRELCELQDHLLDSVSSLVRPGGILVYAVCTVTAAEGPARIASFLARHPDFSIDPIRDPRFSQFIATCKQLPGEANCLRTWTDLHASDSFFVIRMIRGGKLAETAGVS
jgi:16S rRNA (cytosine967-C5)-methyltransferase